MTISTESSFVTYLGNGVTTAFTFPFQQTGVANEIQVTLTTAGVETILAGSQYTLSLNAAPTGQLWGTGGTVTYPISGSPISSGTTITIQRIVPYEQTVTINNQGAIYPQVLETGYDLLAFQIQQVENQLGFAIQAPIVDGTTPSILPVASLRANGFLAFNNLGQPYIAFGSLGGGGGGGISSAFPRKITVVGTNVVNVLPSDSFGGVSIYQSSTPVTTVQLPNGEGPYPVFDGSLNALTYPILILPPVGLTILGKSSFSLSSNGQSATFYNDGTQILIG